MASIEELFAALPRQSWLGDAPPLIVMSGLPASGKSFTAHLLAAHLGLTHVSADQVRMHITSGKPRYSAREATRTTQQAAKLTGSLLAHHCGVVVDAISLTRRARSRYLRQAKGKTAIIWCEVDENRANELFALRASSPGPWDFSRADAAERARILRVITLEAPKPNEADLVIRLTSRQADELLEKLCLDLQVPSCAVHLSPTPALDNPRQEATLINGVMTAEQQSSFTE